MALLQLFNLLRFLPLPVLRAFGAGLGYLVYALMASRRRTVRVNLQLCFLDWSAAKREAHVREVFVNFMQTWLDRFWLWHSPKATLGKRLRIVAIGDQSGCGLAGSTLSSDEPVVIFAPHFVGLDAGWTALNTLTDKRFATIYSKQKNASMDAWVRAGRERSANGQKPLLIEHLSSVRAAVQSMRRGEPLYLLPDMNYEPDDSFFLPFFGNTAATLPILPRYAKLGRAKVVPVITRMTKSGYDIEIHPAWENYPSGVSDAHLEADSLRMNRELEQWVRAMPSQYYWVHRRFKDQPRDANGISGPNPYDDPKGYKLAEIAATKSKLAQNRQSAV
jgi:KDO2-lipid IV(A) lauroyltransferase